MEDEDPGGLWAQSRSFGTTKKTKERSKKLGYKEKMLSRTWTWVSVDSSKQVGWVDLALRPASVQTELMNFFISNHSFQQICIFWFIYGCFLSSTICWWLYSLFFNLFVKLQPFCFWYLLQPGCCYWCFTFSWLIGEGAPSPGLLLSHPVQVLLFLYRRVFSRAFSEQLGHRLGSSHPASCLQASAVRTPSLPPTPTSTHMHTSRGQSFLWAGGCWKQVILSETLRLLYQRKGGCKGGEI